MPHFKTKKQKAVLRDQTSVPRTKRTHLNKDLGGAIACITILQAIHFVMPTVIVPVSLQVSIQASFQVNVLFTIVWQLFDIHDYLLSDECMVRFNHTMAYHTLSVQKTAIVSLYLH